MWWAAQLTPIQASRFTPGNPEVCLPPTADLARLWPMRPLRLYIRSDPHRPEITPEVRPRTIESERTHESADGQTPPWIDAPFVEAAVIARRTSALFVALRAATWRRPTVHIAAARFLSSWLRRCEGSATHFTALRDPNPGNHGALPRAPCCGGIGPGRVPMKRGRRPLEELGSYDPKPTSGDKLRSLVHRRMAGAGNGINAFRTRRGRRRRSWHLKPLAIIGFLQ